MNAEWMSDARKIPDEVMNYIRRIAVSAIEEKGFSPELVAKLFGIDRTSIYDWLRKYRHKGEVALDTGKAPGADWEWEERGQVLSFAKHKVYSAPQPSRAEL